MKIVLAGPYPKGTMEKFQELLPGNDIINILDQSELDAMEDCDVIILRVLKAPAKTFEAKKNLKAVIRWGAGFDSVDIEAAGKKGVQVANMPGVNAYAVAELAVGLMLAVGRAAVKQNNLTKNGIWDNKMYAENMTSLNHKIVGVIGGGNIGRMVAKRVQAFGAEVIYYDAFRLKPEMEEAFNMKYVSLEELICKANVISVHVPLLDSTRHMLGKEQFEQMQDKVIIINTARGGLVDDNALYDAVVSGKVLGAGLDCVENENLKENPLNTLENVIITPHMGGTSNDLAGEMVPQIAESIRNYEANGEVKFIVNRNYIA